MIKIAHIQLLPLLTGVQRVSLDELSRLNKCDFESYIICKEYGPLIEECIKNNIKFIYCKNLVRNISITQDFRAFWSLYKLFKKNKFDIVHTHSSKTGVIGRIAAKLAGVPMVIHTVHGFSFPSAKGKLTKLIYFLMEWLGTKCSDKVICLHDKDRNFAKKYLGAKNKQLEIIPNGVDIMKFHPPTEYEKKIIREELHIPSEAIVIGMVGRLWKQKNPKLLMNSALSILEANKNIHLVFVGDGEFRSELEFTAENYSIKNQVHILGWRSDSNHILKAFDIFVLPSLWEGMPLAILEAQATGIPCIVSNIQGNNHLVQHNINGLLFSSNEEKDLTLCLNKLIDDYSLRYSLGNAGLANVRKRFSIEDRVNKIIKCYNPK
ncbi:MULTISPECIES: glycosyltransferase family 4 protein [Enterobacterales]|uniref:glycosyltransferase family 4 protein n=1 Tax=Enterobacterales TaxID=91347 RepID=UPI001A1E75B1|nr:glycosyltransferase family 4 protein [Providencia sp. PROV194]